MEKIKQVFTETNYARLIIEVKIKERLSIDGIYDLSIDIFGL